jgi:hypothetical protein
MCLLSLLLSILDKRDMEIFTNWNWKLSHFEVWFSSHIDVLLFDVQNGRLRFALGGEERRHLIMHVRFLICKRRPNLMLPFR